MEWLYAIDKAVFNWINQSWRNGFFDWLMPLLSGNPYFIPLLIISLVLLVWKGGVKGRVCVFVVLFVVLAGDGWICHTLKDLLGRPRPFRVMEVHLLVGRSDSGSMPSAHAANWFAAATVLWWYYRRRVRFMFLLALAVSLSRIYNGVHYPSDVLVGAVLGMGYALAFLGLLNGIWGEVGRRWFPLWHAKLPSLWFPLERVVESAAAVAEVEVKATQRIRDQQWLRLGYVLIALLLVFRWVYIASGEIELSEDEAYQWTWSKHLALSYYSKPPLIAYTQWLGTALWGDTAFGVRFFSPLISAIMAFLIMRFMARQVSARTGFLTIPIASTTPMLAIGSILMTIDPLSVLFWFAAMLSGWQAIQREDLRAWLWTGVWLALGFLSKYTALFQLACWAVFFLMWKPARIYLRRPGPYLALLILAVGSLPVLIWNAQHGWVTVQHLAERGGLGSTWKPTLRFFWEFLGAELGVLNPVYFGAVLVAMVIFWRRYRQDKLLVYLFSMGAPLFLFYWAYSIHSRVLPNWIVPAVIPLFCLMIICYERRRASGDKSVVRWLGAGLAFGAVAVIILHDTDLIGKIAGRKLPGRMDPLHRVRAWKDTARRAGEARQRLLAEGKPVFIICDHYGLVGQITFYLPEAKTNLLVNPVVYYQSSEVPDNQYYFWPGYQERKGENAIYIWWSDYPAPPPERLRREFSSVEDLGVQEIPDPQRPFRRLQFFACRGLR
jgi:membrane-associated phospholipid phosphatase